MTGPKLHVDAGNGLYVNPILVRALGFSAGETVWIRAELADDAGVTWRSSGRFVADATGFVDVTDAPSEEGTFTGIDPAGLFWSMQPESGLDKRFQIEATEKAHKLGQPHFADPYASYRVKLTASADSGPTAEHVLDLHRLLPGIEVIPVRDGRLRGVLLRQPDRTRVKGAIMSLTGSGGGVEAGYAPVLASQGYDVFSLAYFAYEDLPTTISSLPLEYFEEGFRWMQANLGARKIAVQGASRGGELTVLLAAYFPQYVSGAIPIVPMYASSCGWDPEVGVSGPSWTLGGKDIPYAENQGSPSTAEMQRIGNELPNGFAMTPYYRNDMDQPAVRANAAIPIERAAGPLLMISGVDDQMWPCSWGSERIVDRLRAKGFPHPFEHLAMRETGHVTPLPNSITSFNRALYHSLANIFLDCGGTADGSARQSRLMWDTMLAHYARVFA
ncbi:MAG: acyl-CoA thioesterase/bile acid-CoA:amino acid N-acyltransferase family protein [Sandaracinobacter sp.]